MASLTLKGIPDTMMERLRSLAEKEGRSLNQQAILLLEQALIDRPRFMDRYDTFIQKFGPSPLVKQTSTDCAVRLKVVLLTRNTGDVADFEGLHLENWFEG